MRRSTLLLVQRHGQSAAVDGRAFDTAGHCNRKTKNFAGRNLRLQKACGQALKHVGSVRRAGM